MKSGISCPTKVRTFGLRNGEGSKDSLSNPRSAKVAGNAWSRAPLPL